MNDPIVLGIGRGVQALVRIRRRAGGHPNGTRGRGGDRNASEAVIATHGMDTRKAPQSNRGPGRTGQHPFADPNGRPSGPLEGLTTHSTGTTGKASPRMHP
jgi:hypothetical protein